MKKWSYVALFAVLASLMGLRAYAGTDPAASGDAGRADAQTPDGDVRDSVAVQILNRVMAHRLGFMGDDEAVFVACDAYRAVGEPDDFPAGLQYADELLQEQDPPCSEGADPPPSPRIYVRQITVDEDEATVELLVVRRRAWFNERYQFSRPYPERMIWYLDRVIQESFRVS